jgi:putative transposase
MPGPKPPLIVLSEDERTALEDLVRAQKTGQALARRARVVLLASMGYSNMDIARLVPMDEEAVGLWRRRWAKWSRVPLTELSVADRLTDAPRPGAVPRLTAEQVCQIVALACEQPTDAGRPISQWTHRELADEIVRRGITDRISPRHAARLLKSGRPPAAPSALLAHPGRRRRPRYQDR